MFVFINICLIFVVLKKNHCGKKQRTPRKLRGIFLPAFWKYNHLGGEVRKARNVFAVINVGIPSGGFFY